MHAVASISQSALKHNLCVVKKHAPQAKIMAMVKADAYGHHLDLISPIIKAADLLAVNNLVEAAKLRQITTKPIVLLSGVYSKSQLQQAISLNCHIVVHDSTQIAIIQNTKKTTNIWIKIETGMHRLGLSTQQYNQSLSKFKNNRLINIVSTMSHFACADEINHPLNRTQLKRFEQLADNANKRCMANSAAILSKMALFDFVRPGIMLYGASPFADNTAAEQLKPVMQLYAPILSIKTLQAGDTVSYGATWSAPRKTTIAIIGIGYSDGYPRHAKTGTPVLINGSLCPLVGRVCMSLICVDIGNLKANVGDLAILWGHQQLRVETVADYSNTISYELFTGVSNQVSFVSTV